MNININIARYINTVDHIRACATWPARRPQRLEGLRGPEVVAPVIIPPPPVAGEPLLWPIFHRAAKGRAG